MEEKNNFYYKRDFNKDEFNKEGDNVYHEMSINSIPTFSKYSNISQNLNMNKINSINEAEMKLYLIESFKKILKIGFPTMLFFLCLYLQQTISLSFIGKKFNNQDMINAIGVVNLYINCCLLCFAIGLVSGLDTLLANSIGSNDFYLFGIYVSRARLITYLFSFILCIFHYFYAIKIIKLFSIDLSTLSDSNEFLVLSLLYVLFEIQFAINFRILAILNKPMVCLVILFFTVLLHPIWCYILINTMNKQLAGAGLSLCISQFLNMALSSLYLHIYKPMTNEGYICINRDSFNGWCEYLKFTLPSTGMLCAEWLAFEVQAIFAISISKEDYSLHIFISNIAGLMYTLCQGFGMAATILVGEYIAKGMIKYSKAVALYSFILCELTMSFFIIILIIMRESVLSIFVDDVKLLEKGKPLVIILAIGEIFDATQSIMAAIYRGLGKQRQASIIAFSQFYIVQIFFSWLLAIKFKLGVAGIWYSILIGNLLTTLIYIYFFTKFDFNKINKETRDRLEKDQKLISKPKPEDSQELNKL
jgi:MATE family multidrug resistance protein